MPLNVYRSRISVYVNQHLILQNDRYLRINYIRLTTATDGTPAEFFYNCYDDNNENADSFSDLTLDNDFDHRYDFNRNAMDY